MHLSQESQAGESPMIDLAKRLGISLSLEASASFVDEINDKELIELSSMLFGESPPTGDQHACIQVLMSQLFCNQIQSHWSMKKCDVFFFVHGTGTSWSLDKYSSQLNTAPGARPFTEGLSTPHSSPLFVRFPFLRFPSTVFIYTFLTICVYVHHPSSRKWIIMFCHGDKSERLA